MPYVRWDPNDGISSCLDCGYTNFILDWRGGDRVCSNCGLVAEERIIDDRPEWRNFSDSEVDHARCGESVEEIIPTDASKPISLTTTIQKCMKSNAATNNNMAFSKLSRMQHQVQKTHDKQSNFKDETSYMDQCMQKDFFQLPHGIRVESIALYVKIRSLKRVNKDQKPALMAMCALTVAKRTSPRTMKEVISAFSANKKSICSARKDMKDAMKTDPILQKEYGSLLCGKSGDTTDKMTRIVNLVSVCCKNDSSAKRKHPDEKRRDKYQLLKKAHAFDAFAKARELVGSNDPEKYAVTIVMLASQEMGIYEANEDFFCETCHISRNTLSKHSKILRNALMAEGLITDSSNKKTDTKITTVVDENRNNVVDYLPRL